MPSYPRKSSLSSIQNGCITSDEYDYHTMTSIKKLVSQPPTTDHSQRTGKLLAYISSMQNRRLTEKEYHLKSNKSSLLI